MARGRGVNRQRARRLPGTPGPEAARPRPGRRGDGQPHRVFPHRPRGVAVERPDRAWRADIAYPPMGGGFLSLAATTGRDAVARRGEQATVDAPGDDQERVLAGSPHRRTGRPIETWGVDEEGRTAGPFLRPPDDPRRAFRQYRVTHVICDNAADRGTLYCLGAK